MLPILMVLAGAYALYFTEVKVTPAIVVRGDAARLVGGILLFGALAMYTSEHGFTVALCCIVGAVFVGFRYRDVATVPKPSRRR